MRPHTTHVIKQTNKHRARGVFGGRGGQEASDDPVGARDIHLQLKATGGRRAWGGIDLIFEERGGGFFPPFVWVCMCGRLAPLRARAWSRVSGE